MEIKDRLKKAMNESGINARELAKRCGLSEATISRYLSGQMEPKALAVSRMAKALHVDPVWLMCLDDVKPDYEVELDSTKILIEELTPSEKSEVERYIKFIISQRGGKNNDT